MADNSFVDKYEIKNQPHVDHYFGVSDFTRITHNLGDANEPYYVNLKNIYDNIYFIASGKTEIPTNQSDIYQAIGDEDNPENARHLRFIWLEDTDR